MYNDRLEFTNQDVFLVLLPIELQNQPHRLVRLCLSKTAVMVKSWFIRIERTPKHTH